ncbi:MAG: SGNH/GDSL hydrolase family protein [Bdellovibrionales bacterium]
MKNKLIVLLFLIQILVFMMGLLYFAPVEIGWRRSSYLLSVLLGTIVFVLVRTDSRPVHLGVKCVIAACVGVTFMGVLEWTYSLRSRIQSAGFALAAHQWGRRYWRDNNSGFRDVEWNDPEVLEKRRVLALGDSFTAGHGIENVKDRFTEILNRSLGSEWKVVNLGKNGNDTFSEVKNLRKFPHSVEYLVFSYFGNDIMEVALQHGYDIKGLLTPYADLSQSERYFVERSYLLNYFYWSKPRDDLKNWWERYRILYADEKVLSAHRAELQEIVDWSKEKRVPMVVVLFPYLHKMEMTSMYSDFIKQFFNDQGISVIDVAELVRDLPVDQLTVNVNDIHPSHEVHRRVGRALFEYLSRREPMFKPVSRL